MTVGASGLILLLIGFATVFAPRELQLTLLCLAGPLVYLGLRASALLRLPVISRLSLGLLAPFASIALPAYWLFDTLRTHLDTRRV